MILFIIIKYSYSRQPDGWEGKGVVEEEARETAHRLRCSSGSVEGGRFWCDRMADTVVLTLDSEECKSLSWDEK